MIHDGRLYVIVSRQKEAVEVLSVALTDLNVTMNALRFVLPS